MKTQIIESVKTCKGVNPLSNDAAHKEVSRILINNPVYWAYFCGLGTQSQINFQAYLVSLLTRKD